MERKRLTCNHKLSGISSGRRIGDISTPITFIMKAFSGPSSVNCQRMLSPRILDIVRRLRRPSYPFHIHNPIPFVGYELVEI